eukprot:274221_1
MFCHIIQSYIVIMPTINLYLTTPRRRIRTIQIVNCGDGQQEMPRIQDHDFTVRYLEGHRNGLADYISRPFEDQLDHLIECAEEEGRNYQYKPSDFVNPECYYTYFDEEAEIKTNETDKRSESNTER